MTESLARRLNSNADFEPAGAQIPLPPLAGDAKGRTRGRGSLLLELIAIAALAASTTSVCVAGGSPPAAGANAKKANTVGSVSAMTGSDYAQCVSDLTSAKVVFERAGDVTQQGCKVSGAIKLKAVATAFGTVGMSGEPTMLCSFARQFGGWVRDVAAPLTLGYAGQRLMRIETGPGFVCRARYDKPGEVPSEHAKGDALDIAAFVLADNRYILVRQQDTDRPIMRDLVHALRMTACGYFTTVLGPGEPAHEAHFHFDSGLHGATPNYRICE